MDEKTQWVGLFQGAVVVPGWYAIMKCWDESEGCFPDAARWDGARWEWSSNATIVRWAGPFPDQQSADAWARGNDPLTATPQEQP